MATVQLKGGFTTQDRRLDRLPEFDEKSRRFAVAHRSPDVLGKRPGTKNWSVNLWLDQGVEGACTGFSRAHALAATPVPVPGMTEELARKLYLRARQLDEWPGEDYEGSSVLAAVKAAQELGLVKMYTWAFTLEEFLLGLSHKGPAVIGCNWYEDMYQPDARGYIHPTGNIAGGHAILIRGQKLFLGGDGPFGIHMDDSYVVWWNSWGPTWGKEGTAKMSMREWDKLRREQADVCFSIDQRPVKVSP